MNTQNKIAGLVILLCAIMGLLRLEAVCDQSDSSQADQDLWAAHPCEQEFYLWQRQAYDLRERDWKDRGWDDPCNVNFEYAKHWNAAYLVTYGLQDRNDQSFHGTVDYRALAEAALSAFHESLYHIATDERSFFGAYQPGFSPHEVQTTCLLYDPAEPNANPASRAGDFMHEGWHAWLDKYDFDNGDCNAHRCGPQGNCSWTGCDYFYFHGIGAYAHGALFETDRTEKRLHSPNQVQVEFLCDVADQSQPWVPASVRLAAQADANQRAAARFINGPGYICGDPRPW